MTPNVIGRSFLDRRQQRPHRALTKPVTWIRKATPPRLRPDRVPGLNRGAGVSPVWRETSASSIPFEHGGTTTGVESRFDATTATSTASTVPSAQRCRGEGGTPTPPPALLFEVLAMFGARSPRDGRGPTDMVAGTCPHEAMESATAHPQHRRHRTGIRVSRAVSSQVAELLRACRFPCLYPPVFTDMEQGHGHRLHRCHTVLRGRRLHLRLAGHHRQPRDRLGRRRSPLEDLPRRPPLCTSRLAGRTRRPIPATGEKLWTAEGLCRKWTFPACRPHHPATAAPRHWHHHRDRVGQTRTGLSRLDRGSVFLPGRSNIRETSAPSIN